MAVRLSSAAAGGVAVLGTVIDPSGAKRGAKETSAAIRSIGDSAKKSQRDFSSSADKMGDSVTRLAKDAAKLAAAYLSFQSIVSATREILRASQAMEAISSGLQHVTGSAAAAGVEIGFLREEADRLGTNFETTAASYTKLAAAAKGTELEGAAVREVFTAISEAAVVMSLTTEQTQGALTAMEQVISKGVLSAEELRGQLGERIPGAFQIAARAMDVTTQELGKMLEQGLIPATDFIPLFAKQLREELGRAVPDAAERAGAGFARLGNALFDLAASIGNSGLLQALGAAANLLADLIGQTTNFLFAIGLLRREIASMTVPELKLDLEKQIADAAALNREMVQLVENIGAVQGEVLPQRSMTGRPITPTAQLTPPMADPNRLNDLIARQTELAVKISSTRLAIIEVERAAAAYGETNIHLSGTIDSGTRSISEQKQALKEHARALEGLNSDIVRINREIARNSDREVQRMADVNEYAARQIEEEQERIREGYEHLAEGIGSVFISLATSTSNSVEDISSSIIVIFRRTVDTMARDAENSGLFDILGAAGAGAATGLAIGGVPGAVGGAVGGALGRYAGTSLASAIGSSIGTAILPGLGTAIGSVLGGLVGGLFGGRDEPKIPQAFFQQANALTDPFGAGTNPQTVTPFGRFLVQMMDLGETPVPQEFMDTLNQIVETIGVLDTALADALGPERTGQIAAALEDVHELGGGEIDEIQLEQIMRRRFEIIFEAIGGEMEETFLRMAEGLDTGAMADLAITLAQIFTAFERGEQVFADIEGPVNTVNALLLHFSRQNETLSGTLQRLAVSMGLVTSLGLDHLEASTGFARFAENFVDALGGMDAAIAQTSAFNRIFGATPSGLVSRGQAAVQQVETAFDAAGIPFSPGMIPTLDEFNRAFMEIQASVDAADLAAWVEAGLALAGLHEILAQMPEPAREAADAVGEAADAIEDIIEEATVNVGAIVGTLEQLRQGEIERGMTDLEVSIHRQRESTLALVEQMQEWGAAEAELTYVRVQGAIAVQDLLDAELERARLATEAEEERARAESARLNEERARTIAEAGAAAARAAEEAAAAEAARQSGIADILAAVADEGLVRNLSDYELALRRLSARYQDRVGALRELDASEEALSLVRSNHLAAVRALADAEALLVAQEEERAKIEAERAIAEAAQGEEDRLRSIEEIMSGINRAAEEMGLSDLELAILRVRRETDATVASLFDLEASAGDIARAIELGERRILEIRKDALNQELALIESLSQSIDGSIGGLIESIAATTRTDEENYDHLRLQAESLAATLGTMTDPAQIENTIREIERLTSAAWGLQGDQPRAAQDFIEFLEGVREISMAQLENARDIAATRAGIDQAFAESLDTAGPLFADAADSLAQDAETISGAADKFSKAVDRFSETARRPIVVETGGAGIVNA